MARGKDTLIVYDDVTTHAGLPRVILATAPDPQVARPFRATFSFCTRACSKHYWTPTLGGGSMTALPIIETEGKIAPTSRPT